MALLDIMRKRYSVRNYENRPVEKEKLAQILAAAQAAPTAANRQPVRLLTVESREGLELLSKAADIYNAPLAIIVCSDRSLAWKRPFDGRQTTDIDASILTDHMMLQATEAGLGTVWICYFRPDIIKKEFHLPEQLEPVNILAVGYSAVPDDPKRRLAARLPIEKLVLSAD